MKQVNFRITKLILPLLLGMFLSLGAYAQQITVKGHVKDALGEPVIGANVVVKGTSIGTITDIDGNFTLNASADATLEISFIGYKSVDVKPQANISVTLQEDAVMLAEAVVIGYGTVKKSDATGAVTAVKADQLNKGAISNPMELLQGKTAGVQITTGGGAPGEGATIRIRGGSSLSASNDPLIVIDGLPISNTGISGMGNALSSINPGDIETFTVLKDASSTAIYGSRASNGVIIITTKKGTKGQTKPRVSIDMTGSLSYVPKKVDVLSGDELMAYMTEKFGADSPGVQALGYTENGERKYANTDWQDEIYRTAFSEEINAGITGMVGGKGIMDGMPYRVSVGFMNQDGTLKTSNMNRTTASVNLTPTFFDSRLTVNLNAKGMYANNTFANQGAIGAAVTYDPTKPIYSNDKGIAGYTAWYKANGDINTMANMNPVALLERRDDTSDVKRFIGNAQFDYKFAFLPELRANLNLGLDYSTSEGWVDTPAGSEESLHDKQELGSGRHEGYSQFRRDESLEFYLNYAKTLDPIRSKFDVMAGYSWQHFRNGSNSLRVKQDDPGSVLEYRVPRTEHFLVSFFGRLNYTLMDRYLLTFTLRNDGTSKFQNNKWGLFPSVALAWRIVDEPWLAPASGVLSDLKLRLGYGVTGQQDIGGDYGSLPVYKTNQQGSYYMFGDQLMIPISPQGYEAKLKWEETVTYNVGLDFGFLNNRFSGSVDFYHRKTNDLLNNITTAAGSNLSNYIVTNVGDLENTGLEFTLNMVAVDTKDWNWEIGFNATFNKNKITRLTSSDDPDYLGVKTGGIMGGTGNTILLNRVGHATNSFFVYQQVYNEEGNPIEGVYVDRNGDGAINDKDLYLYKKPAPDVFLGINTTLSYKKWTLSASGRANLGNYVYNNVDSNYEMQADLWTNEFVSNRVSTSPETNFAQAQYLSDYYIRNASFFRLDKVTLAYQLKDWIRLHATGQNLFTITNYKGLDPEVASGIDSNMYPRPTTFLVGASLTF